MATGGAGNCSRTLRNPATMLASDRSRLSGVGWQGEALDHWTVGLHRRKDEVSAARIQSHDDAIVVGILLHDGSRPRRRAIGQRGPGDV